MFKLKNPFNLHADRDRLTKLYNLYGDRVLGDIPIHPQNQINPPEIMLAAKRAGLGALIIPDEDKHEHGGQLGTVYVYDRKKLQSRLDGNKDMLREAGWPLKADAFVNYLSFVTAPVNSPLYDFIAQCHDVNGLDPTRKPWRQEDPRIVAQQHETAEMSKMRFQALQENDPAAAAWVQDKARSGHLGAMLDTSVMYSRGTGFKQDYAEAAFWAGLAARRLIPSYRQMLQDDNPNIRRIVGPDVKATDSDAEISTASSTYGSFRDPVKLRDEALAQLPDDQANTVRQRVAAWGTAPKPAALPKIWR